MGRRGTQGLNHNTTPFQVQASDHSTELNSFCPQTSPCPIVQRPHTSTLFAFAEGLPLVPQWELGHQSQG